ncbi:MAG: alpha-1,6-mannosyltransferase [Bathelium mastoideum]|nr:MAG: alpha-1,6-mannosyltransferase [Bathelium mastoideum]KAI9694422.1 MAG: alpha-1,6-mannosyltransferase [Bathelium mastoideum]
MSLSRTPSPQPGGGWHSPGLTSLPTNGASSSTSSSPRFHGGDHMNGAAASSSNVTWASAQARSAAVKGHPSHSQTQGFFQRFRRLSTSLPRFSHPASSHYAEKEKLGRGRWNPDNGNSLQNLFRMMRRIVWRARLRFALAVAFLLLVLVFYATPLHAFYQRTSFLGGGSKFVVILAANLGGGVMEWKGPREWAIERDSVRNKKRYVKRWGYELEIVDMSIKKKYAHEWRESWEKVDTIRNAMRKYPHAEWFWWLDLNTFIMEPSYSLQSHLFNSLGSSTYRDVNLYNPLNITHPPTAEYLDPASRSAAGDGDPASINLLVPQDCSGFNLGSFFVRRSSWSDRLMDLWWDPVWYEQKHMEWEHKEQDALEYLYRNQPWVRPHVAFVPQRTINSFPPGACGDAGDDPRIHYQERDRDFLVNMAGCEWGRDCWGEMYNYRQLSNRLNRSWWEKFKDGISETWQSMWKTKAKEEEVVQEGGTESEKGDEEKSERDKHEGT